MAIAVLLAKRSPVDNQIAAITASAMTATVPMPSSTVRAETARALAPQST